MILGSTLIVWAVIPEWREAAGVWTVPHTAPGKTLIGGPSNAGGLFVGWADRMLAAGGTDAPVDPRRVPVWQPYLRGERVPLHDPDRRASLHDLHIGLDAAAVRRAAYEASAFAARHMLDLGGVAATAGESSPPAAGCGCRVGAGVGRRHRAAGRPGGRARGRGAGRGLSGPVTAGLEEPAADAGRWARHGRRVEPDPLGRRRRRALCPLPGAGHVTGGMRRRIVVDRDRCIGSGNCSFYAPGTFDLDDELKSVVIDPAGDDPADVHAWSRSCR